MSDGGQHNVPDGDIMAHTLSAKCECEPYKVDGVWYHVAADGRSEIYFVEGQS